MFMSKKALSVTLDDANLLWLRGRAAAAGRRSVSDLLDAIVTEARLAGSPANAPSRSVAGTIDIADDDPDLQRADEEIARLYERSLARPFLAREATGPSQPVRPAASRKPRRG
jgi:hypothetical protein